MSATQNQCKSTIRLGVWWVGSTTITVMIIQRLLDVLPADRGFEDLATMQQTSWWMPPYPL